MHIGMQADFALFNQPTFYSSTVFGRNQAGLPELLAASRVLLHAHGSVSSLLKMHPKQPLCAHVMAHVPVRGSSMLLIEPHRFF